MDDLKEQLSALFSDPSAIERLKTMAAGLFPAEEEKEETAPAESSLSSLPIGEIAQLMPIISKLSSGEDERTALISAIKPFLSDKRRSRADTALKLLRIIDILPLIKDSGLL